MDSDTGRYVVAIYLWVHLCGRAMSLVTVVLWTSVVLFGLCGTCVLFCVALMSLVRGTWVLFWWSERK